jgi:transposase-like protein
MRATTRIIRKKRKFSEEFKQSLVLEFERGKFSVPQLERIHCISSSVLYRWIYKFSTFNEKGYRVIEMEKSSEHRLKQLEQQVKDLEGLLGRKQIKIDYLEKLIDIAKEEFDIDIKKKDNTSQSAGSEKTKIK